MAKYLVTATVNKDWQAQVTHKSVEDKKMTASDLAARYKVDKSKIKIENFSCKRVPENYRLAYENI